MFKAARFGGLFVVSGEEISSLVVIDCFLFSFEIGQTRPLKYRAETRISYLQYSCVVRQTVCHVCSYSIGNMGSY